MKSEGDILMELRSIESAILTYKELVRLLVGFIGLRKTIVKAR